MKEFSRLRKKYYVQNGFLSEEDRRKLTEIHENLKEPNKGPLFEHEKASKVDDVSMVQDDMMAFIYPAKFDNDFQN